MLDYTQVLKNESTPVYIYDLDGFKNRVEFFKSQMPKNGVAHFAMKSNNNHHVLRIINEAGLGLDVVSLGELSLALELGFKPDKIVFSGVGKSRTEVTAAIEHNISQINVESRSELDRIVECARKLNKKANVAFRMNPDVDADTHPYIRTGFRDNKFGIDFTEINELLSIVKHNHDFVSLKGLTLHIGSQIRETAPFEAAIKKTYELFKSIVSSGIELSTFDVGGGVGIDYNSDDYSQDEKTITEYMNVVKNLLEGKVEKIYFEPGRILVARFGDLITEVQYVKRTPYKNFLIVDAGMHILMRPSLYQAFHRIESLGKSDGPREVFDVVGPICESADVLGYGRYLPSALQPDSRLVVRDVGAYGAVMASRYNLHEVVREICIQNGKVL